MKGGTHVIKQLCSCGLQVKKAVQALLAYLKSTSGQTRLLDETQQICLLLTFWKIPKQEQTIRM